MRDTWRELSAGNHRHAGHGQGYGCGVFVSDIVKVFGGRFLKEISAGFQHGDGRARNRSAALEEKHTESRQKS